MGMQKLFTESVAWTGQKYFYCKECVLMKNCQQLKMFNY